jgi:D-3-phosphoglycerate dehydrogenase
MRILANDGIDKNGKIILEKAGFEIVTEKQPQDKLAEVLKNYDVVLVRSATRITKEIIDSCPNLKLIGRGGVGLDNIDVEHAKKKGIRVINTPASSSISVAELVFAHMFSISRFLQLTNRVMPGEGTKKFNDLKKSCSAGSELRGKTLGIIGFGRIGQETARIGIGLGMNVLAFDPFVENADIYFYFHENILDKRIKISIKTVPKERVIKESDYISLHVPFNEGDSPVLGKKEFHMMKQGVGIVNCARGGVVSEKDLNEALDSGHVAYAGLDVFEKEPPVNDTILKNPKVSLTPHIGASTNEAQNRIGIELADKIIEFFKK